MELTSSGQPESARELPFARALRNGLEAGAELYRQQAQAARPIAELMQREAAKAAELYAYQAHAARQLVEMTRKQSQHAVSLFQRLSAQVYPVPVTALR